MYHLNLDNYTEITKMMSLKKCTLEGSYVHFLKDIILDNLSIVIKI